MQFLPLCFLGLLALSCCLLSGCSASATAWGGKTYRYELNYGQSVILRDGYAIAPRHAPPAVHRIVAAGNRLQGRPYKYGGGHARVEDSGYDCSGTVSYVLIKSGYLKSPMCSKGLKRYGSRGSGEWITIYARDGHTFMTVGGLRLDTGYRGKGDGPTWTTRPRPISGYAQRHPPGL